MEDKTMINDFETQLKKALRKEEEMNLKTKNRIFSTFDLIRKRKQRKQRWAKLGIVTAIMLVVGFPLFKAGYVTAAVDYIQMKLFSETVTKKHFIRTENKQETDGDINIKLESIYSDGNELGFYLTMDYSKNREMVENEHKVDDYSLSIDVKDSNGSNLSGAQGLTPHMDTKKHILQYYCRMNPVVPGEFSDLTGDLTIEISKITGFYKQSKPGLSTKKPVIVTGNWLFSVNNSTIKKFNPLLFIPEKDTILPIESATAYPSSFVVKFSDYKQFLEKIPKGSDENPFQLKVVEGEKISYYAPVRFSLGGENQNIEYMTFNYTGYDKKAIISLSVKNLEEISLTMQ